MDKSHPTEAASEAESDLCKAELVETAPGWCSWPTRPPGLVRAAKAEGITPGKGGKNPNPPMNCL